MTAVEGAQRHARRAGILKRLTQMGFVGYGLLRGGRQTPDGKSQAASAEAERLPGTRIHRWI
jgi:hypothetical protein